MPTLLPRFQVTETSEVARALEIAERAWPDLSRSQRVKRLLLEGAEARSAQHDDESGHAQRLAALRRSAGLFTGDYEAGHLRKLRDDWPE